MKNFQLIRLDSFFVGQSNLVYLPDVGSGQSGGVELFGGTADGGCKRARVNYIKKSKAYSVRTLYKRGCC